MSVCMNVKKICGNCAETDDLEPFCSRVVPGATSEITQNGTCDHWVISQRFLFNLNSNSLVDDLMQTILNDGKSITPATTLLIASELVRVRKQRDYLANKSESIIQECS